MWWLASEPANLRRAKFQGWEKILSPKETESSESLKDSIKNQNPLNYKEIKAVVPKGNQLWIFIGRTAAEAEPEGPILWPPTWRADSLEKTLMLENIDSKMRRGQQRMRWIDTITESTDSSLSRLRETVKDRGAWHTEDDGVAKNWTWPNNWTATGEGQFREGLIIFYSCQARMDFGKELAQQFYFIIKETLIQ